MEAPQRLKFGDQLLRRLGAGFAAIEHDDVAELALKWATPRELNRHHRVGVPLQQIEAGRRRGLQIRLLAAGREAPSGVTARQCLHQQRQGDFPLIEHEEIHLGQLGGIRGGAGEGAPHRHPAAVGLGQGDLISQILLLNEHRREDDQIGPAPLLLVHGTDVAVHQLELPALRQQGRHGDQP